MLWNWLDDLFSGKFLKKIQIERGPTTPRNPTQASKRDCTPDTFKHIYNPNPTTTENRTALLIATMIWDYYNSTSFITNWGEPERAPL